MTNEGAMAGEDPAYRDRVAALPCCARSMSPCVGEVTAHHRSMGRVSRAPVKGADRRAHDHESIPLCAGHHDAWHGIRQPFKVLVKAERAAWEDQQILCTQMLLKPQLRR